MINIALLAHNISAIAVDPHRLAEQAVDVVKTAGVILCLCSTGAVAAIRMAAWQHLIQRKLWLQQTPGIPEPMRRQLLECPSARTCCSGPVCHLWWMTCRPLPRRQRNSGDTSPALRLHPGGSAPLQAPVAAIGPRQSLSRLMKRFLKGVPLKFVSAKTALLLALTSAKRPHQPRSHVTSAPSTKRITFYKSGDSQFGGVKMAVHRRSFKCFEALLDDLSQKVPLPFGVRTVTTPRGTHGIHCLDQLQDGACYLCSDHRRAKPVDMGLAGRRPAVWHPHHHHRHTPQAQRPDGAPSRQRRVLLVKNSEPGRRRSVVLGRRSARSLRAFLEEASDTLQFHVRRLYTAEGRKIDSVQSLMTCPGILVCVGREPFSPLLVDFLRKSSEERLPGLGLRSPALGPRTPGNGARSPATQGVRSPLHGARSRGSEYSEGRDSRKNVNFGLETKKSIIHPRSDSSTRSTRFSLSSEKSYTNGLTSCPHSHPRPAIMNDDIEKRVMVNKDGSLSVEMKVRFRLHTEDTLQWSTQIKKSPSLTNDCCASREGPPCFLQQGLSETCSNPDSGSCDPEATNMYANASLEHPLEANCPCCHQTREQLYDLWENPAHSNKHAPKPPIDGSRPTHARVRQIHSSSSSSSCHSRRVVCQRSRLSSSHGGSGLEQARVEVQEELCVMEEVCTVSRCCSSSGAARGDAGSSQPHSSQSTKDDWCDRDDLELTLSDGDDDRPPSLVSNSSHVLQVLQENQDEEDEELPPSVSQCCQCERSPTPAPLMLQKGEDGGSRASSCHCGGITPHSLAQEGGNDRAVSSMSKTSKLSCRSSKSKTPCQNYTNDRQEDVQDSVMRSLSSNNGLPGYDVRSNQSSACSHCGGSKGTTTTPDPRHPDQGENHGGSGDERAPSQMSESSREGSGESLHSNKSNLTHHDCTSVMSNIPEERDPEEAEDAEEQANREENGERAVSALSTRSHLSVKSSKSIIRSSTRASDRSPSPKPVDVENESERASSAVSIKSVKSFASVSKKPAKSCKPHSNNCSRTHTPCSQVEVKAEGMEDGAAEEKGARSESVMSSKSEKSAKSAQSSQLERSICAQAQIDEVGAAVTDNSNRAAHRAASAMSVKSATSIRSSNLLKSNSDGDTDAAIKTELETEACDEAEAEEGNDERASTQSRCHCGAASRTQKREEENNRVEGGEEGETTEDKEPSEQAPSVHSTNSKRQRINSGDTEELLSRDSFGSVSLVLPEEEQGDSDGGESHISSHTNPANATNAERMDESAVKHTVDLEDMANPLPPIQSQPDITIDTPGQSVHSEKDEEPATDMSPTAHSSRSNLSVKGSKPKESERVKTHHLEPSVKRSTSAMSAASGNARSKTPSRANEAHSMDDNKPCVISRTPSRLRTNSAASTCSNAKAKATTAKSNLSSSTPRQKGSKTSDVCSVKSTSSARSKEGSFQPTAQMMKSDDDALCRSSSAADLLREALASARLVSRQSRGSDKSRSTKPGCQINRMQEEEEEGGELTPALLPNASPNEVVSDWLRSIPTDGCLSVYREEMGDGGGEEEEEENSTQEKESPEDQKVNEVAETPEKGVEVEEEEDEKMQGDEEAEQDKEEVSDSGLTHAVDEVTSSDHKAMFQHSVSMSRNCNSSVAVMKVLLSPSLGRSNSLPEVSPVYGRKLSTSAKGLLDCLAQLQLIQPLVPDPACEVHKDHRERYNEVMSILQSLWLTEPRDLPKDQITPSRSSSGVEVGSGSGESGKDNNVGGRGAEGLAKDAAESVLGEEEADAGEGEHDAEGEGTVGTPTPRETSPRPEAEAAESPSSSRDDGPEDAATDPTPPSSSDKSSSAVGGSKSPTDNEHETAAESSGSGTQRTAPPPVLAERATAADPDPTWALHLLRKLEKQFMSHYMAAMVEFKARWDLEDNVLLDTMIAELRDEVGRRIQSSVGRELKKIQGRAGRGGRTPRPPVGTLSRESTMTERRRQMLKVMKNQPKTADSLSDGEKFSDERSDDEYCPCDACVRKKLAARPARTPPTPATPAPLRMDFDLRKILQLRRDPETDALAPRATPSPLQGHPSVGDSDGAGALELEGEDNNLEVVQEEEEEKEEELKMEMATELVETIPEEEEEEELEAEEGDDEEENEEEEEEEICQECMVSDSKPEEEAETTEKKESREGEEEEEASEEVTSDEVVASGEEPTTVEEEQQLIGVAQEEGDDEGREDSPVEVNTEEEKEGGEEEEPKSARAVTPTVCVTMGEEADGEDLGGETKQPESNDASEAGGANDISDAEKEEEKEAGAIQRLPQQVTRSSVESQPGSMEDLVSPPPASSTHTGPKPVAAPKPIVAPKPVVAPKPRPPDGVSGGVGVSGRGQRRSRSPARVKRRKQREGDVELDDL
ncbi:retinitis pigmentosa 1-like 1 protein [Gadus chalcogrammus]|uniref:retinitis pigmentosa 1-like 1 protein n=1 Tax=Gadus chalcogrammus TaxID=1042646 RepID=UPI0024C34597|nr:retinitis pigmentosa 1-like 1 protein [Gadus chalcogrammus]